MKGWKLPNPVKKYLVLRVDTREAENIFYSSLTIGGMEKRLGLDLGESGKKVGKGDLAKTRI